MNLSGIAETVEIVQEAGGYCKGYVVDISKKEEVYKAADVIRAEVGDVSMQGEGNVRGREREGARQLKHETQVIAGRQNTVATHLCHIIVC